MRRLSPSVISVAFKSIILVCISLFDVGCRTANPEFLLTEAYRIDRTIDLRIGSGPNGPLNSPPQGRPDKHSASSSLTQAEASIAGKWRSDSKDPTYLLFRGRAELLSWDYEAAIHTLGSGVELYPRSVLLKTDLATAYVEKADALGEADGYGRAVELLGEVLQQNPHETVALFNHALACERMLLYRQAVDDWKQYLSLPGEREWHVEAEKHIAEIRYTTEKVKAAAAAPLLSPHALSITPEDSRTVEDVDAKVEDYVRAALQDWLPSTFRSDGQAIPSSEDLDSSLTFLSQLLKSRHRDAFLQDLLATRRTADAGRAFLKLGQSLRENESGSSNAALRDARDAVRIFDRIGNTAGVARAELETVYSLHRLSFGLACLNEIEHLKPIVRGRNYSWIEAQLFLEEAVCSNISSRPGRVQRSINAALHSTADARYPGLHLRAIAMAASTSWLLHTDPRKAWNLDREGLVLYWEGGFSPLRAYNFYEDLSLMAEQTGKLQLSYVLQREAERVDADLPDRWRHALTHFLVARAASKASLYKVAQEEFKATTLLFSQLPGNETTRLYSAYCDLESADLNTELGDYQRSTSILETVRPVLTSIQNLDIEMRFHFISANVKSKQGLAREAETEIETGIGKARDAETSLKTGEEKAEWERNFTEAYKQLVRLRWDAGSREAALATLDAYRWAQTNVISGRKSPSIQDPGKGGSGFERDRERSLGNAGYLTYAIFNDGVAIWLRDKRGIATVFTSVSSRELNSRVREFVDQCSDPTFDIASIQRSSLRLYKWLILPFESALREDEVLYIEGDGILSILPFEALVNADGQYLGQKAEIILSPGFEQERRLRPGSVNGDTRITVVAPPAEVGTEYDLHPLPDADLEAKETVTMFKHSTLIEGKNARWPQLQSALSDSEVFHFAGHSLMTRSGLVLLVFPDTSSNDSGWVTSDRIRGAIRSGRVQLVVLSACSTGSYGDVNGNTGKEILGTLFEARVPHVIATRWQVDSRASRKLVHEFYTRLLAGVSVGRALQLAQQSLRDSAETAHPYFWAGFATFGRE